jgi:Glycosyl hydrolases family 32 N-terminal domain
VCLTSSQTGTISPVLRLAEDWVWDSWIADDGGRYHLFFLRAPRALGDARLRHTAARIGHASSTDLTHWEVHDNALSPAAGRWDDLALWTGSVARGDDGIWRLYYSALSTSRGRGVHDQRIGMAESDDLFTWRRIGEEPLVAPDPRWYVTLERDSPASETWRDPFVFKDPGGDGWHMLITARATGAARFRDGVLGHARSADMRAWELQPPISEPGAGFGELEVSQVRNVEGRAVLVFTCHPDQQSDEQLSRFGRFCTWSVVGESLAGPWDLGRALPFRGEPTLSAAPLVRRRDGSWALLGFRNLEPGAPQLEVVDPVPVRLRHGRLVDLRPERG